MLACYNITWALDKGIIVGLIVLVIIVMIILTSQESDAQDLQPEKKPLKKFLKMDSIFARLYEKYQKGEAIAQFAAKHRIHQEDEMIRVVLKLDDASYENLNELKLYGIKVERQYQNRLQVMIPYSELETISNMAFINSIKRPMEPVPDIISEGAAVMNSDDVNNSGNTGLGIKVGVIDLGFDVTNSEIVGNIQEANSFRVDNDITGGGDTDHGTAVSEIIVDVAPGVELFLFNIQFQDDLLSLITFLINNRDLDVVVMSLGFFNVGPYDGTSDLSLAVNNARNNGMLWVNSAGNRAQQHWQGPFSDTDADGFHNFAGDDETIQITAAAGDTIIVGLTWNETWGSAAQDYDLELRDASLALVASSVNAQTGTQDPNEFISFVVPSNGAGAYHIDVREFSATQSVALELFSMRHDFDEYNVPSSSIQIPADASGSLAVGAMFWFNDALESFSSRGPTNDGRTKPDLSAPDGVTTSLNSFFGTSAAAPHVAGAAALTKKANPGASPATIQTLLEQNTFSNHAKNNNDGTGRVDVTFLVPPLGGGGDGGDNDASSTTRHLRGFFSSTNELNEYEGRLFVPGTHNLLGILRSDGCDLFFYDSFIPRNALDFDVRATVCTTDVNGQLEQLFGIWRVTDGDGDYRDAQGRGVIMVKSDKLILFGTIRMR